MELSRRLFLISLGAADFVTYDQREVFLPTPFCQENVIIWKRQDFSAGVGGRVAGDGWRVAGSGWRVAGDG